MFLIFRRKKTQKPKRKPAGLIGDRRRAEVLSLLARTETRKTKRRRRARAGVRLLQGAALLLLVTALGAGTVWGWRHFSHENEDFRIREIEVVTGGELDEERVLDLAGVSTALNLFSVDLDLVRKRLEEAPYVRRANVERHFPDKLLIRVDERQPVAWLSCPPLGIHPRGGGNAYILDVEGYPMKWDEQIWEGHYSLPVVHASTLPNFQPGKALAKPDLRAALKLVEEWKYREQSGYAALEDIRIGSGYSIRAIFAGGVEVTFGAQDLKRQLADLELIFRHAEASNEQLATVNLLMEKNIAITLVPTLKAVPLENLDSSGKNGSSPSPEPTTEEIRERQLRIILGKG